MNCARGCRTCAPARRACAARSTRSTPGPPTVMPTSSSPMTWKASSPSCAATPPPPPWKTASASCGCSSRTSSSAPRKSPSGTASPPARTAPAPGSATPDPIRRVTIARVIYCVGGVASPLLANVYLHYVLDLWVDHWRKTQARGNVIVTRFADDFIVGFQYQDDAERFLGELRGRLAKFALELHPDKTRLIEFGPHAARNRKARGEGKPETFTFLGFRHIARMTRGRFWVQRITDKKKMAAKLKQVRTEIMRRRHLPVPDQGRWLASVIAGHQQYYAVPGNFNAVQAFRTRVT